MKSFKQHMIEEFRGEGKDGIFKNPTPEEIKSLKPDVRGWVDDKGDFYIGNRKMGTKSLHDTIMSVGGDLYKSRFSRRLSVTLHRIGNTKSFALGELEPRSNTTYDADADRIKQVKPWLKKARTKNKGIVFLLKNIWEMPGYTSPKDFFRSSINEDT